QVYIEGQLRTRNWQDDAGVTRYVTEVLVGQNSTLQMLGGRREAGVPESATQSQSPAAPSQQPPQPLPDDFPPMDDEAPF
ncbi:TPA: single-stranded DNA-binding protein, partial [Klebsiella pneumoniae]|nr:single-stranded DNA-binding protein [Klebsiella pneumoniae]HBX3892973.1 single-stranded DNA-binding protein [Klebsiella pneumoniae subsp. pneumoniae]HBZ9189918.1 single-stranded DNA-binding protein [Klebsiella pneumoniae]HCA0394290.1 single-stranded DNA-binding protein [Klebsiella pneumoniae]HCA0556373.1 single-stranded DNA-binding protein [Klebsiella pneumoniae]